MTQKLCPHHDKRCHRPPHPRFARRKNYPCTWQCNHNQCSLGLRRQYADPQHVQAQPRWAVLLLAELLWAEPAWAERLLTELRWAEPIWAELTWVVPMLGQGAEEGAPEGVWEGTVSPRPMTVQWPCPGPLAPGCKVGAHSDQSALRPRIGQWPLPVAYPRPKHFREHCLLGCARTAPAARQGGEAREHGCMGSAVHNMARPHRKSTPMHQLHSRRF
mmetsp:Transcript_8599/g.20426  ORF Transcript_8599/g.20426 Transcript_8599/m.20426 type:complete len:217 (+) Transcript_8599:1585-2235(+)